MAVVVVVAVVNLGKTVGSTWTGNAYDSVGNSAVVVIEVIVWEKCLFVLPSGVKKTLALCGVERVLRGGSNSAKT